MLSKWMTIFALAAVCQVGLAQETKASLPSADTAVATVNGEPIRAGDYYRRMEYLPGVGHKVGPNWVEAFPALLTLDALITERLLAQMAKDKQVYPTASAVATERQNRIAENPSLVNDWKSSGRSEQELDDSIRADLIYFNLLTYGINITNQEVRNFYEKNPTSFTIPKQVRLSVCAAADAASAESVDKALAAGTSFADVAKQYSLDVSRNNGGKLDMQEYTALSEMTRNAIDKIKVGDVTEWIHSENGVQIKFQLNEVIKEHILPFNDALAKTIRLRLLTQRGMVKNDVRRDLLQSRSKAQISIADPAFGDAYNKFIADYLKSKGN